MASPRVFTTKDTKRTKGEHRRPLRVLRALRGSNERARRTGHLDLP